MSNRNLRRRVVREARRWVGTPYLHQGSVPGYGCDCLGLVRGVWRKVIGDEPQEIPGYSRDWGEVSGSEVMLDAFNKWFVPVNAQNALVGDVLLFRWKRSSVIRHSGILSGRNKLIHAYERAGVVETTLGQHWAVRIAGAYRFPDHNNRDVN